ncbi:MAG: hypothetical protein J6D17_02885 [Bacteroides sp.]|nr:hypothetical protein [Bacteroides sp.]
MNDSETKSFQKPCRSIEDVGKNHANLALSNDKVLQHFLDRIHHCGQEIENEIDAQNDDSENL